MQVDMPIDDLPQAISEKYDCYEWRHAISILKYEFQEEYNDLVDVPISRIFLTNSERVSPMEHLRRMSINFCQKSMEERRVVARLLFLGSARLFT